MHYDFPWQRPDGAERAGWLATALACSPRNLGKDGLQGLSLRAFQTGLRHASGRLRIIRVAYDRLGENLGHGWSDGRRKALLAKVHHARGPVISLHRKLGRALNSGLVRVLARTQRESATPRPHLLGFDPLPATDAHTVSPSNVPAKRTGQHAIGVTSRAQLDLSMAEDCVEKNKSPVGHPIPNAPTIHQGIAFVSAPMHAIDGPTASLSPSLEIIELDPAKNGIEQITEVLEKRDQVDAVLFIGSETVDDLKRCLKLSARGTMGAFPDGEHMCDGAEDVRPTPMNMMADTDEDTPVTIPVLPDRRDGEPCTITAATQGVNGTVVIDPATGNPIYTPDALFLGADSFTCTFKCEEGREYVATVAVDVHPEKKVVTSKDVAASTQADSPVTVSILPQGQEPSQAVGTVTAATQGANGTVVIDPASGDPIYMPDTGFTGSDAFTCLVSCAEGPDLAVAVSVTVTDHVVQTPVNADGDADGQQVSSAKQTDAKG